MHNFEYLYLRSARYIAIITISSLIAACGGGGSDGTPPSAAGGGASGLNSPPVISGSPPTTVVENASYSFTPTASDADLDSLTFSIANTPGWASFDIATGRLSGTPGPGDVGTTTGVQISVSDGSDSAALPAFDLTVTPTPSNEVTISNTQPTDYEWDGLAAGAPLYIDRNYTIVNVPSVLQGLNFLRTANDDKFISDTAAVTFDVDQSITVYVAYDVAIATLPAWLQNWTDTGEILDGSITDYRVFARDFSAGTVSIGGNEMGFSMFVVAVSAGIAPDGSSNAPPSISGTPAAAVAVGSQYLFAPIASDPDGDTIGFSIVNRPGWATFDPVNGTLLGTPASGDVGSHNGIQISASDGLATSTLVPFSIEVTAATPNNTPPAISGTPPTAVLVGNSFAFTPTATDVDGDSLAFSIVGRPGWADFDPGTGSLTGTPGTADVGTYNNIRITVTDGKSVSALTPFSITVQDAGGGNSAPAISGVPANSITEGNFYSFVPNASDADGDPLSFSIAGRPGWASFNTGNGALTGTPGAGDVGTYNNIRITVSDGQSASTLTAFSITVIGNNSAPTISGSPATNVNAGNAYSFVPAAADADGDPLTFSIAGRPGWASFNTGNGALTGTPGAGDVGTYNNIRITVSDGQANSALSAFSITVVGNNSAPTISGTPANSVNEGVFYSFTPTANDADGDALTFSIAGRPGWASFNSGTGALTGTPGAGDVGTYNNIRITVSDGQATTTLTAFSITVVQSAPSGSANVTWTPPTTNEDGSTLNDLAGFRVYYGPAPQSNCRNHPNVTQVNGAGLSSTFIDALGSGTWHFAVTAFDTSGNESVCSNNATKSIP